MPATAPRNTAAAATIAQRSPREVPPPPAAGDAEEGGEATWVGLVEPDGLDEGLPLGLAEVLAEGEPAGGREVTWKVAMAARWCPEAVVCVAATGCSPGWRPPGTTIVMANRRSDP